MPSRNESTRRVTRWTMSGMCNLPVVFFLLIVGTTVVSTSIFFDSDRSGDGFGRQFFVVLPVETDISISSVHTIFISSRSRHVVQANISRPDSSWTGIKFKIQPNVVANVTFNMTGSIRHPFNPNGIPLQINASNDVAVWVTPARGDSILGGYRAIPRETLGKNYATVMYPSVPGYSSEIVIFSPASSTNLINLNHDNFNYTVTIDNTTTKLPLVLTVPRNDSAKMVSSYDLSGLALSADFPMSVTSGRRCRSATSTSAADQCTDLVEQVSPLDAWGQSFVVVPQETSGPATMKLRVVSGINNTTVSTYAPSGALLQTWLMSDGNGFVKDVDVTAGKPITIRADKPILVTQFFTDGRRRLDYAAMLNVPPVEQFTNSSVVFPALNHTVFRNTLIVVTRCEHRKDILLNGKDISNIYQHSVHFSEESNFTIHGSYCTLNTTLLSGSHTLKLRKEANVGSAYSAILYGAGANQAYAYQIAADLREIVCDVIGKEIELCDFFVPPDYTLSPNVTGPTSGGPKPSGGPDHWVIILVVLSSIAVLIVGIIILGKCGKDRVPRIAWSRLKNTSDIHYDTSLAEEDGVRMDSV